MASHCEYLVQVMGTGQRYVYHIVEDTAVRKREWYEPFLVEVELLKSIDVYEKMQIPDALRSWYFSSGSMWLSKETRDVYYIVERWIRSD